MSATPPPPQNPPFPPPPRKSRSGLAAAVVAIVVVIVVVVGLILAGVIPLKLGSSSTSTPVATSSYSSAESLAASVAQSAAGAPWHPVAVEGLDLINSYSNSTPQAGCTLTGGSDTYSVGAYTGNYSNGQLANWLFVYLNSGATSELGVQVSGGHATDMGTLTASASCQLNFASFKTLPGSVADSTQIATSLLASPVVDSFVHSYTTANAQYILVNSGAAEGTVWAVTYSGCALPGLGSGPSTGATIGADLNASTGAILGTVQSSPASTACSGSSSTTPIATSFVAGNPVSSTCASGGTFATTGCTGGDFTYTLTIEASSVTFGSVLFKVENATGSTFANTGVAGFAIRPAGGSVAAYSTFSAGAGLAMSTTWANYEGATTSATPLTSVDAIVIDMGQTASTSGEVLVFIATGTGSYSGTASPVVLTSSSEPIGAALAVGYPILTICPSGDTFATNGCLAGDYSYTLVIEQSTVDFGNVLFEVKIPAGTGYVPTGPGGFSVMNISGGIVAQTPISNGHWMLMNDTFATYAVGISTSTPLTNLYTIVIDMGTLSPDGQGDTFVVMGTNGYTGTTSPVSLP